MQYLFLLGRQAALSRLEILSVWPKAKIVEDTPLFLILETDEDLPDDFLNKLGGTDRVAVVVGQQPEAWRAEDIVEKLTPPPENKFRIGISVINHLPGRVNIKRLALDVKKLVKSKGGSMKFILPAPPGIRLNAAQVIFNSLTKANNKELLLVEGAQGWYLAQTRQVQDIQAYEKRDTGKPVRDAKVGMLPPKVAQMIINIALPPPLAPPQAGGENFTILDPFCGTGTVLQEGWLMGHNMIGMDSEERMIRASKANLDGLAQRFEVDKDKQPKLIQHDARQEFPKELWDKVDAIVTEPFLGKPLQKRLSPSEAQKQFEELGELYSRFFAMARQVLKEGGRVLFLLPAYKTSPQNWSLFPTALFDEIGRLGYRYEHLSTRREDMIYARPDALVGREFTLFTKENGT